MLNLSVASHHLLSFAIFSAKATVFSAALVLVLQVVSHNRLINDIYKHVGDLDDGKMLTTVTSYPSGPEVVGILGGSSEGLNCSLGAGRRERAVL